VITLAFYKGRGKTRSHRFQDALIRLRTSGQYSHVELISGRAKLGERALCFSASGRDGGVREKHILLTPESWDLVEVDIDPTEPIEFIRSRIGAKYDYTGILLSQALSLGIHEDELWFCSEIVAAALRLPDPQRFSPQFLFGVAGSLLSNARRALPVINLGKAEVF